METILDSQTWESCLSTLPGAHILQSWEWGQVKAAYGWTPIPTIWRVEDGTVVAAALVLERELKLKGISSGLRVLYVPRGPLMNWENRPLRQRVLKDLQQLAHDRRAIFIKIDPEIILGRGIPASPEEKLDSTGSQITEELSQLGWSFSSDQIQFRNTAWLDLSGNEEEWLVRMKPKTRYNLRLAAKKGVKIRSACEQDLSLVYHMYAETSVRDGFVIRPENYYQLVWKTFIQSGKCEILLAEVGGDVIAGLALFFWGQKAWYLYGMSRDAHREKMPNYLLQWEAMRMARKHGALIYDLWGAPDEFTEADSMWGVFRFKEGLGAQVIRTIGAWDFPVRPVFYRWYTQILPRLLDRMRRRGKQRTRQEVAL